MKPSTCLALPALILLLSGCSVVPKFMGGSATNSADQASRKSKSKDQDKDKDKDQDKDQDKDKDDDKAKPSDAAAESGPDVSFLLSMSYAEASSISPQKITVPPFTSVAADSIEVLSKRADGTPKRVRAKGHVFVQMENQDEARALCQEALISGDEVTLRGRPILQRGASTVEGLSDVTVFFVLGHRLRAIGPHKLSNANNFGTGPWASAANPLLPPLDESAVPSDIRDELNKAAAAEALHQRTLKASPAPPLPQPE